MDDHTEFVQESAERITQLNNDLLAIERDPDDEEAMRRLFRTAHTLKGNAGGAGFDAASDLAHALEDVLEAVRSGRVDVTSDLMDVAFDAVDELESMVDEAAATGDIETDPEPTIESVREVVHRETCSGATSVTEPTTDEIDAVLSGLEAPTAPDFEAYVVRLAVTETDSESGAVPNGVLVLEALIDAFDVLGTDPDRDALEDGTYGGRFDAVFASAVGEEAIAAALEPIEVVADFAIQRVSDRFDALETASDGDPSGADISADEATDLPVGDLLDEFDEFDNLDEKVKEVEGDDDLEVFDEMGEAGSFDDLFEEADVEPEPAVTESPAAEASSGSDASVAGDAGASGEAGVGTEAQPGSSAGATDEDQVDDTEAVFAELKEEVDPVGFDELQSELEELEFDEFEEEEIGMDELLAETDEVDESAAAASDAVDADDALESVETDPDAVLEEVDTPVDEADDAPADAAAEPADTVVDEPADAVATDQWDPSGLESESESGPESDPAPGSPSDSVAAGASDSVHEPQPGTDSDSEFEGEPKPTAPGSAPEDVTADDTSEGEVAAGSETDFEEDPDIVDAFDDATGASSVASEEAEDDPAAAPESAEAGDSTDDVEAAESAEATEAVDADKSAESTGDTPDTADTDTATASEPASPPPAAETDATLESDPDDPGDPDAVDFETPDRWSDSSAGNWSDSADDDVADSSADDWAEVDATGWDDAGATERDDWEPDAESTDDWADSSAPDWTETASDDWAEQSDEAWSEPESAEWDDQPVDSDGLSAVDSESGSESASDSDSETESTSGSDPGPDSDFDTGFGSGPEPELDSESEFDPSTASDPDEPLETADTGDTGAETDAAAEFGTDDLDGDHSLEAASVPESEFGLDDPTESEATADLDTDFGFDDTSGEFSTDSDASAADDSFDRVEPGTETGSEFGTGTESGHPSNDPSREIVDEPDLEIPDITVPAGSGRESSDDADEIQSIRVDVEQIDDLLSLVEGLVTTRGRLRHAVESDLDRAALEREIDGLDSLVTDLQGTVMDVRLVPLETVTSRLPRIVRDVAREQDKEVALELSGMDVELDRAILERLRDPLVHLVRNAVDHGIESPPAREAADKAAEGQLEVSATRSRDRVTITVADDGRGLDPDALRAEAVEAGVLDPEEADALSDDEALELAFHPGLSTAAEVTDVSGRGVGMDVVRRTIEDVDGTVAIDSTPGEGTTIRLTLPVSIAIDDVLFLEVGDAEFGVPTSVVQDVEPIEAAEMIDGDRILPVDGEAYPVLSLSAAFGTDGSVADLQGTGSDGQATALESSMDRASAPHGMLIRIRDDVRPVALACDRVRGQQEVVVKPYVGFMGDVPGLSGATVRGRGTIVNILDVTTL